MILIDLQITILYGLKMCEIILWKNIIKPYTIGRYGQNSFCWNFKMELTGFKSKRTILNE